MGFSISWVAFKGARKTDVLKRLKFRDLDAQDEPNEAPFSMAELPTGWVILFANDFDYGTPEHLVELSAYGTVLACQVEEHVMFSAAYCYTGGKEDWSVSHDSEKSRYDVSTRGMVPSVLPQIEVRLKAQQDGDGGEKSQVDYIFDVPVELAAEVTGYRHDRVHFEWGVPYFTVVERDN